MILLMLAYRGPSIEAPGEGAMRRHYWLPGVLISHNVMDLTFRVMIPHAFSLDPGEDGERCRTR